MLLELLIFFCVCLIYLLLRSIKNWNYWSNLGIYQLPNQFPFGSGLINWDILRNKSNFGDIAIYQHKLAKKYGNERFYGTYMFGNPILVIGDPEIAKQILVKDFNHFVDRNGSMLGDVFENGHLLPDVISKNMLTMLRGNTWKATRSTFTPIFTSGKMKAMLPLISSVSKGLMGAINEDITAGEKSDLKILFGKFSMGAIASCAFGLDAKTFGKTESPFVEHAKTIFRTTPAEFIKFITYMVPAGSFLMQKAGIPMGKAKENMFFYNVITSIIKERKINPAMKRNDLIDMMMNAMEAKKKGSLDHTEDEKDNINDDEIDTKFDAEGLKFDLAQDIALVSTAMVMLAAGYDTTSQAMSTGFWILARQPEIQEKLQTEIDEAIMEHEGNIPDYNTVQNLPYLNKVISEILRLYPALPIISRGCVQDCSISTTDIKLKVGADVYINVAGIHMDPKHYPDPEKFDPERFSPEEKSKRHPYAFLTFGQGPRACIGMRFALLEIKMAMIEILSRYSVVKIPETVEKLTLAPGSQINCCKEDLLVKFVKRSSSPIMD